MAYISHSDPVRRVTGSGLFLVFVQMFDWLATYRESMNDARDSDPKLPEQARRIIANRIFYV